MRSRKFPLFPWTLSVCWLLLALFSPLDLPAQKQIRSNVVWNNATLGGFIGTPIYFPGSDYVFILCYHAGFPDAIQRISLKSGKIANTFEIPFDNRHCVAGVIGANIAVAHEGKLSLLNNTLTRALWTEDISNAQITSIAYDNNVFLLLSDEAGKVSLFDLEKRQIVWVFQGPALADAGDPRRWRNSPPAIDEQGNAYLCNNNTAFCLDIYTGEVNWTTELSADIANIIPAALDMAHVYFGDSWHNKVFSLSSFDGKVRWEFPLGANYYRNFLISKDKTLFSGSGGGKIFAIDTSNGTERWNAFPGAGAFLAGLSRAGNPFVATEFGKVLLLDVSDGHELAEWDFRDIPITPSDKNDKREEVVESVMPLDHNSVLISHNKGLALLELHEPSTDNALWFTPRGSSIHSGTLSSAVPNPSTSSTSTRSGRAERAISTDNNPGDKDVSEDLSRKQENLIRALRASEVPGSPADRPKVTSVLVRDWQNREGKIIDAAFIGIKHNILLLWKAGKLYRYPIDQLSEEDVAFVEAIKAHELTGAVLLWGNWEIIGSNSSDPQALNFDPAGTVEWEGHGGFHWKAKGNRFVIEAEDAPEEYYLFKFDESYSAATGVDALGRPFEMRGTAGNATLKRKRPEATPQDRFLEGQ